MHFALVCVALLAIIAVSEALIPLLLFKSLIPIPIPLPLPLPIPIPIPKPLIFGKLLGGKTIKVKISADAPHGFGPEVHIGGYAQPQYKESKQGWAPPPPPPPPHQDQHYAGSENEQRYEESKENRDVSRNGPNYQQQAYSSSDHREIRITADGVPLFGSGTVRVRFHG